MTKEITLQQGLDKFQEKNVKFFSDRSMSEEATSFLLSHDVAHIVFGCNTSIYGEGTVKVWTTFGTNLGFWKVINGYNKVNAFSLFRKYSLRHIVKNIVRFLLIIPKTIRRSRQMSKPWIWSDYQPYLNKPISDIRKEFNIKIIE